MMWATRRKRGPSAKQPSVFRSDVNDGVYKEQAEGRADRAERQTARGSDRVLRSRSATSFRLAASLHRSFVLRQRPGEAPVPACSIHPGFPVVCPLRGSRLRRVSAPLSGATRMAIPAPITAPTTIPIPSMLTDLRRLHACTGVPGSGARMPPHLRECRQQSSSSPGPRGGKVFACM